MRVRKDQKGFTIVELLIAVAILSIVVASVCGFILVGSRSYASANSDINVQQSAQLALNQMSDVLIDTTRSVNYVGYDAGGSPVKVLKDAEFTFTPEDKSLIMYNGVVEENMRPDGTLTTEAKEGNGNKHYQFYWSKQNETLYYAELPVQSGDVDTTSISFPAFTAPDPNDPLAPPPAGWVELAAHVTDFSVDLTQVEEKRVVMLALTFLDGKKEYVTSNNVTIRNKVGVNDAALEKLDKKKTLAVKIMDKPIVEPGETFHFSVPKVTGTNVADKSVKWTVTLSGSASHGTTFTDDTNGILKVSEDEPSGSVKVTVTTNAVDSEGNHASDTVEVAIKRVNVVTLTKASDDNPDNGPKEVSPGCTFTVSVNVGGNRLGETCSVCGEDTSIDRQVSYQNNPCGCGYIWRVYNPSASGDGQYDPTQYVEIIESAGDHATFHVKDSAPTSDKAVTHGFVIQAVSLLSLYDNAHGRHYAGVPGIETGWVPGAIDFTVVKGKETAEPYKGDLKYGEQQLDESIRAGLPTDYSQYVEAIRVVDNSHKEPDKILLHYTIGGGNNFRICPDLFDLDLNGSYTFYMQAIFPIPEERYEEGHGGTPDDNATIRDEYFNNIRGNTASEGYTGTKYRHGKVFYAKLDKPKVTFRYKEVEYTGKNITYDLVNIFMVGNGSGIIGEIKPSRYENIEGNQGMNGMVYSLYEGKESSQSQWNKLYYFDDGTMSYQGNRLLGDGVADVSPGGNPYMMLKSENNRTKVCGNYHIVPGMLYQNKEYKGNYEIIGWQGFDYPNLPRDERYYELDDSTIHVEVGTNFNLELWSYHDNQFTKGVIHFPTPSEAEFSSYFNMERLEWQDAKKLDSMLKLINGSDRTTVYVPSSMKCRYVADRKVYQLELFYSYYDSKWNRKMDVSAGVFQCGVDGKKWERKDPGTLDAQLESGNMNPQVNTGPTANVDFWLWGNQYKGKMYIPLPSESAFVGREWDQLGFERKKETEQIKEGYRLKYQPDGQSDTQDLWNMKLKCTYSAATDIYTLQLFDSDWNYVASFTCKSDGKQWAQQ